MQLHYKLNYDAPVFIRDNLRKTDLLQLPPRSYLSRFLPSNQIRWAEPRFIYYVAGPVRVVPWTGELNPEASQALIMMGPGPELRLVELRGSEVRSYIQELYDEAEDAEK